MYKTNEIRTLIDSLLTKYVTSYSKRYLNSSLNKTGGYHPFENFLCRPLSKVTYLDLSDILHGHFDENNGGTTLQGPRASRQRPV